MLWYMTYIRTIGRRFTLNDPDTVAWLATTMSSIVYLIYNIQINVQPEQYGIAEGKIQTNSVRSLPMFGKLPVLMTGLCKRYRKQVEQHELRTTNVRTFLISFIFNRKNRTFESLTMRQHYICHV